MSAILDSKNARSGHDSVLSNSEFESWQQTPKHIGLFNVLQYQKSSIFNNKVEIQLDLFKLNDQCHGNHEQRLFIYTETSEYQQKRHVYLYPHFQRSPPGWPFTV